jgi:hypothetical protein
LYHLHVELLAKNGRVAATSMRLAVYAAQAKPALSVHAYGSRTLRTALGEAGFAIGEPGEGTLTIADRFDAALRERVLQGEHVVLLASDKQAITASLGPLRVQARAGTPWQGSWASSFCWMRGDWPGDGILDDTFLGVMPSHVITGVAQQAFSSTVLAGLCVGWIQKPVALAATQRLGRGQVTVSTFNVAERLGADPVADMVLQALIQAAQQ